MLLMLLLAACGQKDAPAQTTVSESTQIANPWREITEAEAKEIYPQTFTVPDGAEKAAWRVMESAGASAMLELDFELNGLQFTARQQQTGNRDTDLSGMYYTWTAQDSMTLRNGLTGTMYRCIADDETADLCVWYDPASGVSYSLGVTAKDLDGFDLRAVAEALFPPAAPSAEEQKRILEENRSLWAFDESEYETDWYYAFTDLDHNGLLEVLSASTQGSGIYTYVRFYEVLPDGSGVRNLYHADAEIEGPDDWPEIILDSIPCYYDRAADRHYYVCSNIIRDGAAHGITQLAALCLKDGVAEWEVLASADVQWTEEGEEKTYTDGAGNPITEKDYSSAVERRFTGMEQSELKPDWIAVTARPAVEKLSNEQALAAVKRYCTASNPDLESTLNAGEYQVYWEIESSNEREIVVLFRSYTGALIRYYIDSVSGDTRVTEFVPGITPEEQQTEERFNARDFLLSIPGTWQTASVVSEEDGTAHPAYHVRFTDSEILYGHMKDGAFVIDHADTISRFGKTAAGGFRVQAEAANGVQYTFQTSESDSNVLEYYETWNETDFPDSYRGGASLSRCI